MIILTEQLPKILELGRLFQDNRLFQNSYPVEGIYSNAYGVYHSKEPWIPDDSRSEVKIYQRILRQIDIKMLAMLFRDS